MGKSVHVLGTDRTDKKHGYFRAPLKTWKAEVQVQVRRENEYQKRETSEDALARCFTTYHRHRRHRVGRRRQRTSVRTGTPGRKRCHFRSLACCLSNGRRSDRADRRHSRTWKNRRKHFLHIVAAPGTGIDVSEIDLHWDGYRHSPLGIADIACTHLAGP